MKINDIINMVNYNEYVNIIHSIPYCYQINKQNKKLFIFGTEHSNDASSELFLLIQRNLELFSPDIVMVEGMIQVKNKGYLDNLSNKGNEYIIENYGENVFAAVWANTNNIKVISPEPKMTDEIKFINQNGYDMIDIYNYYMFRFINQCMKNKVENIDLYIKKALDYIKYNIGYINYDIHTFKKMYKNMINKYGDLGTSTVIKVIIDPIYRIVDGKKIKTVYNQISRLSMIYRDYSLLTNVIYEKSKRIFIIYGASHAYLLKKMFENYI